MNQLLCSCDVEIHFFESDSLVKCPNCGQIWERCSPVSFQKSAEKQRMKNLDKRKRFTFVTYEGFREDMKLLEDRYATRGASDTIRALVKATARKARRIENDKATTRMASKGEAIS